MTPQGPAGGLSQGDSDSTAYPGLGEPMGQPAGGRQSDPEPFAHLYRDQRVPGPGPAPQHPDGPSSPGPGVAPQPEMAGPPPAATAAKATSGSRAAGILKSSAVMAAGTLVSRLTGFVRQLVVAAAIGLAALADTYNVPNTLPTMLYILVGGGAVNAVFVPQLVRAMKNDDDGGEAYANRLLTLVMVGLAGVVTVCVLAAPLLIRLLSNPIASDPDKMAVAVVFARYQLPTIFFMGVHVVLGQVLNARGRFGAMMWTPVLNNIVIIFAFSMFIWVYGTYSDTHMDQRTITPEGVRLLGMGTLLGLTVQALSMVPYLRETGFKFRLRFDWRGHGLGKSFALAKWTFLFVLANQAGLIVVTQLATAAGDAAEKLGYEGTGIAAYQNAMLIWGMPQAIITVSVMTAVLPRISRAAADGDTGAVRDDISYGLRTSAVAIVPASFAFLALGVPNCTMMFSAAGASGARAVGYVLMAFSLGLIPFSVQYVVLRGFYAFEDTRTPFYNTVIVAAAYAVLAALSFVALPSRWATAGMGVSYGVAYAVGVGVAVKRLRRRVGGDLDGARIVRTYARLVGASIPATLAAGATAYVVIAALGSGVIGSVGAVLGGGIVLIALFYLVGRRMHIEEMTAMASMVRGKLGR